jgi:transcriptional regulator with XRE-family HTH domain
MNEEAANNTGKPRRTVRPRGRPKGRGVLAKWLGRELQKSRLKEGLDLLTAAELAEMTSMRLAEIEQGATTVTISTIERIAEKVKLDWSTVLVTPTEADESGSSTNESEAGHGA